MTKEQFKRALKEVADKGQNVWYLMGCLQVMFNLSSDKETDDLMYQISDNGHKEHK